MGTGRRCLRPCRGRGSGAVWVGGVAESSAGVAGRTAARKWASSSRALRRRSSWRADQPPRSTSAKAQHAATMAVNPAHSQVVVSTGRSSSAFPQACPMITRVVPVNAADPIRRAPTSHVARIPDLDTDTLPISYLLGTLNLLQHGVSKIADAIDRANTLEFPRLWDRMDEVPAGRVPAAQSNRVRRGQATDVRNLRSGRPLNGAEPEG